MNIILKIKKFISLNRHERVEFLLKELSFLNQEELLIQEFKYKNNKGINLLVGQIKPEKIRAIVTSHYDGPGAYDNTSGVIGTLKLIKYFLVHNKVKDILFAFVDLEEKNLLGSKYLFIWIKKNTKKINKCLHFDIGGLGVGESVIALGKDYKKILVENNGVLKYLKLKTDSWSSEIIGGASCHIFSLPKQQAENFVRKRIFPNKLLICHSPQDNPTQINRKKLFLNCKKIIKFINQSKSENTNFLNSFFNTLVMLWKNKV